MTELHDKQPERKIYATPKRWFKTGLMLFLGLAISIGTSFAYTRHVDNQSNQAWCDMFNGLNRRYQQLPPTADPDALEFAKYIADLRKKYKCY